jgi:hypothetical protein
LEYQGPICVIGDPHRKNVLSPGPNGVSFGQFWSVDFDCEVNRSLVLFTEWHRATGSSKPTFYCRMYGISVCPCFLHAPSEIVHNVHDVH